MVKGVNNRGNIANVGYSDPIQSAFSQINTVANIGNELTSVDANLIIEANADPLTQNILNIGQLIINATQSDPVVTTVMPTLNSGTSIGQLIIDAQLPSQSIQLTPPQEVFADPAPRINTLQTLQITGPVNNQEWINIGTQPNDGTGDPLRVAFDKINNNFTNLFWTSTTTTSVYTQGLDADQLIFEYPANQFTQAVFQIRSSDPGGMDSQDITISAQIKNGNTGVKYTGYAITFEGNAVSRYGMDVLDGNVRLLASPLINTTLLHFISSEITFIGNTLPGLDIGLNGYINSVMGTEDDIIITTEQP